jgi:hypothetical protein
MDSTNYLNKIEEYLEELLGDGEVLHLPDYAEKIAKKFKLVVYSTEGTSRVVFKKKGSRTVIKTGHYTHNRAEYAAYKALEHSLLGDLLAPCLGISEGGFVLEMAFIPKPIPNARGEYYWFSPEFAKIRDNLESHFSFIKQYNKYAWGADFHEENMRVDRHGDIKIIDYSNLLSDMFRRRTSTTVKSAIRGVLKLEFPKVNLKLYCRDRVIHYNNNGKLMRARVDPESLKAC